MKRQVGGTYHPTIIDKGNYFLDFDGTGVTQKMRFGVRTSTNGAVTLASNQYLRAGVWYHIAGVYTGSQMKLYINGVLDNTVTGVTGVVQHRYFSRLGIGNYYWWILLS